jgi:hypothetical protein
MMSNQISQAKPVVWSKWKLRDPTVFPNPRSGHTISYCRNNFFVFGGTVNGLNDPNSKKLGPTNELWLLELGKSQYGWTKLVPKGDSISPRTNHIAVVIKKPDAPDNSSVIFIHGGMSDKGKLDDCYILDPSEMKFTKVEAKGEGPSPRANHAGYFYENKLYIFGGNGGKSYENSVFKDLWVFDYSEMSWTEIKFKERKIHYLNYLIFRPHSS